MNRPLDEVYPVIFIDAIVVKVRDGQVRNKPIYVVIGVTVNGERDILGLWAGDGNEGAKFWLQILTELKNRGVADVCIAVCDGLKGLPETINSVWELTTVQACILHLIRNTFCYASRKYWDQIGHDLRPVYAAATEAEARARFVDFADKWGRPYPAIRRLWENAWSEFVPFHTVETGSECIRDHLRRPNPHTMKTTDQIRSTVFLIDPGGRAGVHPVRVMRCRSRGCTMSLRTGNDVGGLEWYDVRVHEPNRRVSMNEVDAADELGPVDWIVVEFPGSRMNGEIVPALRDLVERDLVRVLDLLVLKKDDDGSVEAFELSDLDEGEIGDLRAYESELAMLLSEEDVNSLAAAIEPGSSAGVLVWENTWAAPFISAVRRSGGQLAATGRIPVPTLLAAIEAGEQEEAADEDTELAATEGEM